MKVNKDRTVARDRLLYDPVVLQDCNDEYGPATEIKHNVRTAAKIYEIRTALRYWNGGSADSRINDAVWMYCECVDNGSMELVDGSLEHI